MSTTRSLLLLPLVLLACSERPLGDTESGTTGPTTGGPDTTLDPTSTTTTTSTTTATVPTTGGVTTSGSATTEVDPSATTVVDPGDTTAVDPSDTTASTGRKLDLPGQKPWPEGLSGCNLDAPAGTDIGGASQFGPFVAKRAYFDWTGFVEAAVPVILFVSPAADPAVEVALPEGSSGPIYFGQVATDPLLGAGWLGTWGHSGGVYSDQMVAFPRPSGTITITELAGNWDAVDPNDPPRLVGTIEGAISGPFDAIFCDKLGQDVFPE